MKSNSSFVILGNTSFLGYRQREHQLALELARRGYHVTYVEGMPSAASLLRSAWRQLVAPGAVDESAVRGSVTDNLQILTPPAVPTTFRSSLVPAADRKIFQRWFATFASSIHWDLTVLLVTFPYWWHGLVDRSSCPAVKVIYDVCDSLLMPSRNIAALRRMESAERLLVSESDLITYSAQEMEKDLRLRYPHIDTLWLPNAISEEFLASVDTSVVHSGPKVIGYVGALDDRWADRELLLSVAGTFPECRVRIRSSVSGRFARKLRACENVELIPFVEYAELTRIIAGFDVALIPFRKNDITRVVNPLKLYEYCSAGIPIIAVRTAELDHYANVLMLASSETEFISLVRKALAMGSTVRGRQLRFARQNTWRNRVSTLLRHLEQKR